MMPAAPEAPSAWPMLSLTDPRNNSSLREGPANANRMLSYSIGSPTGVPNQRSIVKS